MVSLRKQQNLELFLMQDVQMTQEVLLSVRCASTQHALCSVFQSGLIMKQNNKHIVIPIAMLCSLISRNWLFFVVIFYLRCSVFSISFSDLMTPAD